MYDNKGKICDYVTLTGTDDTPQNGVYEFTVPLSAYQNLQRSQSVSVSLVAGHINTTDNVSNSTLITYESGCMNSYKNVLALARPQIYAVYATVTNKLHYIDNAQPIEVFTQPRPTKIRLGFYTEEGDAIDTIVAFGLVLKFTYYNEQETAQNLHNQNTALLK